MFKYFNKNGHISEKYHEHVYALPDRDGERESEKQKYTQYTFKHTI